MMLCFKIIVSACLFPILLVVQETSFVVPGVPGGSSVKESFLF